MNSADVQTCTQFDERLSSARQAITEYLNHNGPVSELKYIETQFKKTCSDLRTLMRRMELAVDEADSEEEAQACILALSKQRQEYEAIQEEFKATAIKKRQSERKKAESARLELLGSGDAMQTRKKWKTEVDVVAASEGITESLRRTKNIMAQELEHSGAQIAAIEMSQERLKKTHSEYGTQHSLLKKSKGLLKVIDWQNKSERYLLWAGLWLFCLVSVYIIQKRALYFVPPSLRPVALLRYALNLFRSNHESNITTIMPTEDPDSVMYSDEL